MAADAVATLVSEVQIGTNDGHIVIDGSQHTFGGIEGRRVPVPGSQRGTKSGHGYFSGSQHAPVGSAGMEGSPLGRYEGQIGCVSAHCIRVGSQQGIGGL